MFQLFICIAMGLYLFCTLSYNLVLFYLFCCLYCLALTTESFRRLKSECKSRNTGTVFLCALGRPILLLLYLEHLLTFWTIKYSNFTSQISCPGFKSKHFYRKMLLRNQDLGRNKSFLQKNSTARGISHSRQS